MMVIRSEPSNWYGMQWKMHNLKISNLTSLTNTYRKNAKAHIPNHKNTLIPLRKHITYVFALLLVLRAPACCFLASFYSRVRFSNHSAHILYVNAFATTWVVHGERKIITDSQWMLNSVNVCLECVYCICWVCVCCAVCCVWIADCTEYLTLLNVRAGVRITVHTVYSNKCSHIIYGSHRFHCNFSTSFARFLIVCCLLYGILLFSPSCYCTQACSYLYTHLAPRVQHPAQHTFLNSCLILFLKRFFSVLTRDCILWFLLFTPFIKDRIFLLHSTINANAVVQERKKNKIWRKISKLLHCNAHSRFKTI